MSRTIGRSPLFASAFAQLLDPVVIHETTVDGFEVVFVNGAFLSHWGTDLDRIATEHRGSDEHLDPLNDLRRLRHVASTCRPLTTTEHLVTAEGATTYRVQRLPILDAGRCTHIVTIAEPRLRIAPTSPTGVPLFDDAPTALALLDGDGRVTRGNAAFADLCGVDPAELSGLGWWQLCGDRIVEPPERLPTAAPVSVDHHVEGADGHRDRWVRVQVAASPRSRLASAHGIIVATDVTDLKRAQDSLAEAVADRERIALEVAHELRNTLTSVVGFLDTLSDPTLAMAEDERRDFMQVVADQAADATRIVDDLMVAANADGGMALQAAAVDIDSLVGDMTGTEDSVAVDGSAGVAFADPDRTRQILRNLLSNAAHHGGETIQVRLSRDKATVTIAVCDDGPSLSVHDREAIFEPFRRAVDRAPAPGSLGLGLAVSRRLARVMGGELTYAYRDGWARFEVTLPIAP